MRREVNSRHVSADTTGWSLGTRLSSASAAVSNPAFRRNSVVLFAFQHVWTAPPAPDVSNDLDSGAPRRGGFLPERIDRAVPTTSGADPGDRA